MSSLNRRNILAGLETILKTITSVKAVVRSYMPVDIEQYATTSLPLIEIREPAESPDAEMTSRRQIVNMDTAIRVFFLSWAESPAVAYESLVKEIRNKVGVNFNVSGTATACWVVGVGQVNGEMPLYQFSMTLRVRYYLNEQDA